ncbi:carbohydrate binding domain-containing protein [Desulfotruncus alcoholivorax]|uniref:hypothetical protein n=1 Tax=Desulfotruncus alcoholivorax TaxID=265477 RepID=UPI0003FB8AC2|nr:hypothetical protein [Desulfotruncus alcoholivorax]
MPKKLRICIFLLFLLSMFFSSVPLARADKVDAAALKQMFDRYGAPARWDSLKDTVDSPTLAWSETYIMRSYLLMYQATKDKQYIDDFVDHADSVLARRDNMRGVTDYRGLSLPVWRDGKYTDYKTYYIYADETGLIATPLAQFAVLINKDPNLAAYRAKANEYVQAAEDAVNVLFMSQLRNSDVNFTWIEDGDTLHLDRPVNKNLAVGGALLAIYEATGDNSYLYQGIKMANYFKQHLLTNSFSGGYYWKYYPEDPRFTNTIEDTNHANVALQFIAMAYDNGIFSAAEMQKFANTAAKVLIKSDGTIANRLDGSGTIDQQGQIANWLVVSPWSPSLFDVAYNIINNKSSLNPPEIHGLAYLNYVLAQKDATNQPPGGVPNPTPAPVNGGNLINNGDFSAGSMGWVNRNNTAQIKTESNGNKYLTNTYNFAFYQDMQLKPATYQINAKTRKGTAVKGARIVIRFYYQDGSDNFKTFTYTNNGSGWEAMPGMTLVVPSTAATTRIYLSGMPGDSGTQDFDDLVITPVK